MRTVSAYEAKTRLAELLRRVDEGERFVITRRGVPVAVLAPAAPSRRRDRAAVIAAIEEFAREHSLGGLSLRDLVAEGRL